MRKHHYLYILLALAVTAFLTTGCGSSGGSSSVTVAEPEPTQVSATLGTQYDAVITQVDMSENALGERFPIVTFRVTNELGQPVSGLTDGLEFTIAKRDVSWQSYINRSRLQSGGVKVLRAAGERQPADADLGNGYYRYTFKTDLNAVSSFKYYGNANAPDGGVAGVGDNGVLDSSAAGPVLDALNLTYDATKLHRIAISARPAAVEGVLPYRFNAVADFKPEDLPAFDSTTRLARDRSVAVACNSCHAATSLSATGMPAMQMPNAHGNTRFDNALCVTCHNPNTYDSRGSTDEAWVNINQRKMIHQIHAGTSGPVDGTGATINEYLGSITAMDSYKVAGRDYTGLRYPQSMANCNACHPGVAGPGSDGYRSNYTQTKAAGTYPSIPYLQEYYTPTYTGRIVSVTMPAGDVKTPTVVFEVLDAVGDPVTDMQGKRFEFTIAKLIPGDGRQQSYWQNLVNVVRSPGQGTTNGVLRANGIRVTDVTDATAAVNGIYSYTFTVDLADPAANNPSGADFNNDPVAANVLASLDLAYDPNAVHRVTILIRPSEVPKDKRDGNATPFRYNAVADFIPAQLNAQGDNLWSDWELERQIVTNQSCGTCHDDPLFFDKRNNANGRSFHSNWRFDVNLCATCHNRNTYDRTESTDNEWVTLDLARMIHQIHSNTADYQADGRDYTFVSGDYSSTRYPLAITDCKACHDNPLAADERTNAQRNSWNNNPSIEACGSCHTDFQPQAHFTSFDCATCHTPAGIMEVHSR
ncbi:multiheme c-type cytochrome [Pelovirga terrestris]|uniref:Outer membrane cytochrome MtrC/MtrF-like domain-containing protein n=1 Tax=Pelovirga terrestris TaxID=2771352 RepID=A0A8J6QXG5_9BACT|nr:cytochrome c3 family protein [Pelovirga terrestris]MBD1400287.1 hypothetical protein [Pelovirga terrestris]